MIRKTVRSVLLAWIALAFSGIAVASAQSAPASNPNAQGAQTQLESGPTTAAPADNNRVQRARELFMRGVERLQQQLYTDALNDFEASFELVRRPNSLNNIGVCLRAIGRHREARDRFNQLLTEFPNADPGFLDQARQFRDEEARKVVTLTLTGLPDVEGITVRIDSRDADMPAARPARFEVDPGMRSVDVSAPDYEVFHWSERATEGESLEVPVNMVPIERQSIVSSPWLWIAVVAVVAAGAGVTYYFVDKDAQLDSRTPITVHL